MPREPVGPTQEISPFLRWAGSKRKLLPTLKTYWNNKYKRYLEPFAGSACLFFSLDPPRAILGDLNPELISTYLEVKYRLDDVLAEMGKLLPESSKEEYLRLRSTQPHALTRAARAARFIYLNRFCFNGIYRTNLKGEFNVPYGGKRCGFVPSAKVLKDCSTRMRRSRLLNTDFEGVLEHAEKGDFVYMDPPFAIRARRVFSQYDPSTFTTEDIARLRRWMEKLDARGINFVVSYAESDEANVLRKNFVYETVSVRRNIAGFAGDRVLTKELLISNI